MIKKMLAGIALVGTLITADMGSAGAMSAHAMKVYTSKAHGYSMSYPSDWKVKLNGGGQDAEFRAPDGNGFLSALGVRGTATKAEIKSQQRKVLLGLGKPQGAVSYGLKTINGISYQVSEIVSKATSGQILDVIVLDTVHGAYLYDFEAISVLHTSTTKKETGEIIASLNSITIHA